MLMSHFKTIQIALLFISSFTLAQVNTEENCGNIKTKSKSNMTKSEQLNVLNTPLALASIDPMTGFYRNGYCQTGANDTGLHIVAALVTEAFLNYSLAKGNDLISAYPSSGFPGLKPGDTWCLCVLRWKEAFEAGVAPPVILEATNIKALQYVTLEQLQSVK